VNPQNNSYSINKII